LTDRPYGKDRSIRVLYCRADFAIAKSWIARPVESKIVISSESSRFFFPITISPSVRVIGKCSLHDAVYLTKIEISLGIDDILYQRISTIMQFQDMDDSPSAEIKKNKIKWKDLEME